MRLENKKAIVTGGAGGIGRATALAFAAEGAAVAVVDLREDAALAVVEEIRAAGGTAVAIAADVSNEDDIQRIIATTVEEFGGVNVVFNNAGIIRRTTAVETTAEEWDRVFGVNVKSIFLMCKHVVPIMEANGGGSIVNTGSGWGLKGGGQAISMNPINGPLNAGRFILKYGTTTAYNEGDAEDRKSTRLNSSHVRKSRMPSSA